MNPHSNIFLTLGIIIRYHICEVQNKYHIQANVLELWYLKIIYLSQLGIYLWIIKKNIFTSQQKFLLSFFSQGTLDISEIIIIFIAYASWFRLALFYVNKKNCHLHAKYFLEVDKILRLCIQRHILDTQEKSTLSCNPFLLRHTRNMSLASKGLLEIRFDR